MSHKRPFLTLPATKIAIAAASRRRSGRIFIHRGARRRAGDCAGYQAAQRQTGSGRCEHDPSHLLNEHPNGTLPKCLTTLWSALLNWFRMGSRSAPIVTLGRTKFVLLYQWALGQFGVRRRGPTSGPIYRLRLRRRSVLAISWGTATSGAAHRYSRAEGLAITFNKEAVSSGDQGEALPDFLKSLPKPSLAAGS